jgi:hypothetical protein
MTKQEALEETQRGEDEYCNTEYFDRFLRKVDRSGEGELIEKLFGSDEAYIDTAGDYSFKGYGKNGSIIDYEEENGYDVKGLFKWYCANFEKAWRWMFPLRKKVSVVTGEIKKDGKVQQ